MQGMNLRLASLVVAVAVAGAVSFLVPDAPESYLTLERCKRPPSPAAPAREIIKHARNTRPIPINSDLVIRRVAPGSPNGPIDLHHQPWDWVEIFNRSDRTIPMEGYSLSDNPNRVRKYRFPAIVIPPHSGCRIWLSGFTSMNSIWSLTPTDAIDARGWKVARNDDMSDRFTYIWLGYASPKTRPHHDPREYRLEFPVRIEEAGHYALWLHAGVQGSETSRLHATFKGLELELALENQTSLAYVPLVCPTSEDGYWKLNPGTHTLCCTVLKGDTLIGQVAVLRRGEPFGQGTQELHAGLKLKQSGEFIGLFDPKGMAVDHVTTPALATGMVATRDPKWSGKLRIEPVVVMEGDDSLPPIPRLDVPPGPIEAGTRVRITCDDPLAVIRYTLHGELPGADSQRVDGGIPVTSNTILRARAFDASGRGGPVADASYWVGGVRDLPILSVIAEPDQLYDYSYGMMYNSTIRGIQSERRCHLTLIETNGQATATVGGIRIQGRSSRRTETKRNFRFVFRERYGQPLWPGKMFTGEGPSQCRSFVAIGRNIIRNQLAHELMDLALVRSPRRRPIRLFVNGDPFGLYFLLEDVQDPNYLESVFGHLDLDVIKEKTFEPVKWGSRTTFDKELLPFISKGGRVVTYEDLSALMDTDMLCRWVAVVQYAGIEDSGQGYYVRDHRVQGPPWTTINWDFDHAFVTDKVWPLPQGYRSRLLLTVKSSSTEFQKVNLFPSFQDIVNHVAPLARLPERARELMAIYEPYLDEEFQAHLNQRSFRKEIPDSDEFMAMHYHDRWEQLLRFMDTRRAYLLMERGEVLFGAPPHVVRIEAAEYCPDLIIDAWPARHEYVGYYYEGTELSVGWKEPSRAHLLDFEINGVPIHLTELRTNVTEDLVIRIRKSDA